jgi:secreted trypsin-like serine protease
MYQLLTMMNTVTLVLCIFIILVQAVQIKSRQHDIQGIEESNHMMQRKVAGGRIIGGAVADPGQFPYATAIYTTTSNNSTLFCTGALTNPRWIITAGQCVDGALSFTIRVGSNKLNSDDPNAITLTTQTYFLHPDYNPATFANDIGLIKLRMPLSYNDHVWSVDLLAGSELPDSTSVLTYGWGQTSDEATGLVDDLNYVDLVTLSNEECKLAFGDQVNENMVCVAGDTNEGICKGDLGSPLIQRVDLLTYHVGVATFISSNGCESNDPSGFTRTWPYAMWIINTTYYN